MFMKPINSMCIQNMFQMLLMKMKEDTWETQFPKDLESAFEIGKKIAIQAKQHG